MVFRLLFSGVHLQQIGFDTKVAYMAGLYHRGASFYLFCNVLEADRRSVCKTRMVRDGYTDSTAGMDIGYGI